MDNIKLEIGDFLGFCDMSGEDALTSDQIEKLEGYIVECQNAHARNDSLVPDSVYDRLVEILYHVNPNSSLVGRIWEETDDKDFDESDNLFIKNPMYSIQTIKSLDCQEIIDFQRRLPTDYSFDMHWSLKENGWGIRVVYKNGEFCKARTRARASNGRDITKQLGVVLKQQGLLKIDELVGFDYCEVRGELLISLENFDIVKANNPDIRSPFSAVSSMVRDSATEEEWGLLYFIAYRFIGEGMEFQTKTSEYEYLSEELGFEVPMWDTIKDITSDEFLSSLSGIVEDIEADAEGYEYYTDGIVYEVDDRNIARSLGQGNGNYNNYNVALKVGFWKQDMYSGYIQTILWMKGKTKLTPVAIVSEDEDDIEFIDGDDHLYVVDIKDIANYKDLGVVTSSGNRVRRVPLYEPSNMLALDAYKGNILNFRYGGEAGVLPCYSDGTPLIDGKIKYDFSEEGDFLFE